MEPQVYVLNIPLECSTAAKMAQIKDVKLIESGKSVKKRIPEAKPDILRSTGFTPSYQEVCQLTYLKSDVLVVLALAPDVV